MKVQKETIQKLKTETKSNPAANAVLYLLALRERSRSTLTLGALTQRMKAEGFEYSRDQYRSVLSTMAKSGVGTPIFNRKGATVGIKDINVKLSDLGKAALDVKEVAAIEHTVLKRRATDKAPAKKMDTVGLTPVTKIEVTVDGKPISIQCPVGMTSAELVKLIDKLQGSGY